LRSTTRKLLGDASGSKTKTKTKTKTEGKEEELKTVKVPNDK